MRHYPPRSVSDDFRRADEAGSRRNQRANGLLVDGCEVPPSYEVFAYELEEARRGVHPLIKDVDITPEALARHLSGTYQRVNFGDYRDGERDFPSL